MTGAGNGIGRAIAHALVGEGMRTVFADVREDLVAAAVAASPRPELAVTCAFRRREEQRFRPRRRPLFARGTHRSEMDNGADGQAGVPILTGRRLAAESPELPSQSRQSLAYGRHQARGPGAPHEVFATLRCCIDHAADEIGMPQLRLPPAGNPMNLGALIFCRGSHFLRSESFLRRLGRLIYSNG